MGEKSGRIVFINSHDYRSDATGEEWVGCLAALCPDEGQEIFLYTKSSRLHQTLEMAYASGRKVTVSFWDQTPKTLGGLDPVARALASRKALSGMFIVKAIWTLE